MAAGDVVNFQAIDVNSPGAGPRDLSPPRRNWGVQTQHLFTLGLYRTGGTGPLLTSKDAVTEFAFPAGLEGVDSSEAPATTVTLLQQDGVHIERGGIRQKPFMLSGTTGLRPHQLLSGGAVVPILGTPLPSFFNEMSSVTGLSPSERTGFDDLVDLVNLLRGYQRKMKASADARATLRLVFTNGRLGESWIVEPIGQGIRIEESARSPMTYRFEIPLLGLLPVDVFISGLRDQFAQKSDGFTNFFKTISSFANKIQQTFGFISTLVNRVAGIAQATITTVLSPLQAIVDGLRGVINSGTRFLTIPRNTILMAANSVIALVNDVTDFTRPGYLNRAANPFYQGGMLTDVAMLQHQGRECYGALVRLAAEDRLFAPASSSVLSSRQARYGALDHTSHGNRADLRNARATTTMAEEIVSPSDTIDTMARRTLGDASRWMELVLANGLRPPYVSRAGNGRDVLRPGDRFLHPSTAPGATGNNVARDPSSHASTTMASRLGQDVLLVGNTEAADWALANGDFAMVSGGANFAQAIAMRMATPLGGLPCHPGYGVPSSVGDKQTGAGAASLTMQQVQLRGSLLQDPRVASVDSLRLVLTGNMLRMVGALTSIASDEALNFNFATQG